MQNLPLDTTKLGTITCIVGPEPRVNRETGQIRQDRDGNTIYLVGVVIRAAEGRQADTVEVAVPGQPRGIAEGMRVVISDLTVNYWEIGDRSGISFRASAIHPAPVQAGPAGAGKAAAGAEK